MPRPSRRCTCAQCPAPPAAPSRPCCSTQTSRNVIGSARNTGEKQQTQSVRRGQQQSRLQPVWRVPARRRCRMSRAAAPCTPQHARFCGHPKSEHGKGEVKGEAAHRPRARASSHRVDAAGSSAFSLGLSHWDSSTGAVTEVIRSSERHKREKIKKKLCRAVRIVSFVRKRKG